LKNDFPSSALYDQTETYKTTDILITCASNLHSKTKQMPKVEQLVRLKINT